MTLIQVPPPPARPGTAGKLAAWRESVSNFVLEALSWIGNAGVFVPHARMARACADLASVTTPLAMGPSISL